MFRRQHRRKATPTPSEWPPAGLVPGHTAANQWEAEHGMWIFSFLGWRSSITCMKWLFLPPLKCAKQYWRMPRLPSATEMYGCLLVCGKFEVHFLDESGTHSNGFIQFCIKYRKSYIDSNHMQICEVVLFRSECFLCSCQSTSQNQCGDSIGGVYILKSEISKLCTASLEDFVVTSVLPQVTLKVPLLKDRPVLEQVPKYRS